MIIKQIFKESETEVKWYFDSIEEIAIVYIRNRLRGTFVCACHTLRLCLKTDSKSQVKLKITSSPFPVSVLSVQQTT